MFLIPLVIFLLFLFAAAKLLKTTARRRKIIHFGHGNGLPEYRKTHPEHCLPGMVACYACGSDDLWLEKVADGCFNHRCRTCATLLYQSNDNQSPGASRAQQHRNLREWMEDERRQHRP